MSKSARPSEAGQERLGSQASAYAMLTMTSLFWGCNAVASRLAVGNVSPMTLTCIRWGLIILFLGFLLRAGIREKLPVMRAHWKPIALMGMFGQTAFNGLYYFSAHHTTAMNILIIQGAIPALVMLGAFVIFRTRIGMLQGIGMAVALGGVVLVATGGSPLRLFGLELNLGDLMMLGACVMQATYYLALRNRPPLDPLILFFAIGVAAFVSSVPLLAWEIGAGATFWPTPLGFALLAFVSIFPSTVAQVFLIRGIRIIGPSRAGLFVNLVPVFGALLAIAVLGEQMAYFHLIALAAVVCGIVVAELSARKAKL